MQKKILFLIILIISAKLFSQDRSLDYEFGSVSNNEMLMQYYEKDSTANALVLYEQSETLFLKEHNREYIETTIYRKIKIFNQKGFERANVSILLYNNKELKEKIIDIKAITHNDDGKVNIKRNAIFRKQINEHFTKITFTFPNVKVGSILEFTYKIKSPFIYNFTSWEFQTNIHKVQSVFKAEIPIRHYYKRKMNGVKTLSVNDAYIKNKNRFIFDDIQILVYVMEDIPPFFEEEYMTSKKNFISKISFEMSNYKNFNGEQSNRPLTWKDIDEGFNKIPEIKSQYNKNSFFRKQLPIKIVENPNDFEKAKSIFYFIQNHFEIDSEYRLFSNINIKKAYRENAGSIDEINLSLINTLNSVGIPADLIFISTRNNGFPTKAYADITSFNYLVVKTVIDNKIYYLDASDKSLPFGVLPYSCLNGDARVMDLKKGSYWEKIKPINNSKLKINMILELDITGNLDGKMRINHYGYDALETRKKFNSLKEDKYLFGIEEQNENLYINSYTNKNLKEKEKPFTEEFEIEIINDDIAVGNKIILNPFFINRLKENPFKLKSRLYPVDFGYPKKIEIIISILIPENYEVESMPTNKYLALPNNKGKLNYSSKLKKNKININFKYSIDATIFNSNEYQNLKEFFNQIIFSQIEPIILKRQSQ